MKKLILMFLMVSSVASASECKISISADSDELSSVHMDIIRSELGDRYTEDESMADFSMRVTLESQTVFDTWWVARGFVGRTGQSFVRMWVGSDTVRTIPLHFITLGIGTMIPTKGNLAVYNMVKKIPSCEVLETLFN